MNKFIKLTEDKITNIQNISTIERYNIQDRYTSNCAYQIIINYGCSDEERINFSEQHERDLEYDRILNELK